MFWLDGWIIIRNPDRKNDTILRCAEAEHEAKV